MEKKVKWMTQYAKLFAKAMKKLGLKDYKKLENLFRNRYMDYLCSEEFDDFKKYGSIIHEKVFAALAFVEICKETGLTVEESVRIWENEMSKTERSLLVLGIRLADSMKNGYKKVANHFYNEAELHRKDGSLIFEKLEHTDEVLEYKITRCVVFEVFVSHGHKEFCKVFCNKLCCLEQMKSMEYKKHSDMFGNTYCHGVMAKR